MKKISLGYKPEANASFPSLGVVLGNYLCKNTENIERIGDGKLEWRGPGKRLIKIKYDLKAPPENNVHEIEISDLMDENRILSELQTIYKRFGFSPLQ